MAKIAYLVTDEAALKLFALKTRLVQTEARERGVRILPAEARRLAKHGFLVRKTD